MILSAVEKRGKIDCLFLKTTVEEAVVGAGRVLLYLEY
jgi:hypothetical protein